MTTTLAPSPILPDAPLLAPHDEAWLTILRAQFELIRTQMLIELRLDHPGARHRIAKLIDAAVKVDGQILALGQAR